VHSSISSSRAQLRTVIQIALAAAAIVVCYDFLIVAAGPRVMPADDGVRNRIIAEQYFDGPVPTAVLVGSSVAARLAPDQLHSNELGGAVYNLALLGEGASTGAETVLRKTDTPKIVLVDPSFGYRASNASLLRELAAEPRAFFRQVMPAFRLENRPLDLAISVASGWLRRHAAEPLARSDSAVEQEPPTLRPMLRYWISRSAEVDARQRSDMEAGIKVLGQSIDGLRARNVRVVLLQFPMHPELAATPVEALARQHLRERFPTDRYEWLSIPSPESYQTRDGMHATAQSARRLAAVLRQFVEQEVSR
jgi:hypothetical protein